VAWTRFAIAFDLHGIECHGPTVAAFHKFVEDFKPQRRIIGGDLWDFAALRDAADEDDSKKRLTPDFEVGLGFLERFRPEALLLGNHDRRLWKVADRDTGQHSELAGLLRERFEARARALSCRLLPYDRRTVLRLGPLNVLHGNCAGENACRKIASIYGPAIFGHVHTGEHASVASLDHRLEAWSSPCMCNLDMGYTHAKPGTLKWVNGWMAGEFKGKAFHVETIRRVGNEIVYATQFKSVAA
jgi:hypothetical protein